MQIKEKVSNNTEIKEIKIKAATRVKPGDRWKCVFNGANDTIVFESLIDSLEYIFQQTGTTQFFMDSKAGITYMVTTEEQEIIVEPPKKFSLYGED